MANSILNRIIISVKNKTFLAKTKRSLDIWLINIFIHNKALSIEVLQWMYYKKLKKKYAKILNNQISPIENNSDTKKRIWFCWLQGYENAPPLVKVCYNSIRKNMSDKEIVFITNENIQNYITFPGYIEKKVKDGSICPAHYSDLIRLELLCNYGGMWIDATVLCTSSQYADKLFSMPFFMYKKMNFSKSCFQSIECSNWLIVSEKNNPILLKTRELLYEYWRKERWISEYLIFHLFFSMAAHLFEDDWQKVPMFNNHSPHVMQAEWFKEYDINRWNNILMMSGFHKLNHHINVIPEHSIYEHIISEYAE